MACFSLENLNKHGKKSRGAEAPHPQAFPIRGAAAMLSALRAFPAPPKMLRLFSVVFEPRAGQRGKTNSWSDDLQEESFTLACLIFDRSAPPRRLASGFRDLGRCQEFLQGLEPRGRGPRGAPVGTEPPLPRSARTPGKAGFIGSDAAGDSAVATGPRTVPPHSP